MLARLLDLVFPPKCAACDALVPHGLPFCARCAESLVPIASPRCTRCGLPFAGGVDHECADCARRAPPYDHARAAFEYGGELATALLRLKYAGRIDLARTIGPLLGPPPDADLVVPVPLHRKRLAAREFNQALEIARAAWPRQRIDPLALARVRDTPSQARLDAHARRDNVRRAFAARARRVAGRRIALVDDVMTTGATAEACARALREAGAEAVVVVTLTRAV